MVELFGASRWSRPPTALFVVRFAIMRPFLLFSVISLGLLTSACGETSATCDELDCDDGNPCTEDSCSPSTVACENNPKSDWARCDFEGRTGACESGSCVEWRGPMTDAEREQNKALCENRSIEECEEDVRCDNLIASRYDETLVCLEPFEEVGCTAAFRICGLSLTIAESPDGDLYSFGDTCHPKGWTHADDYLRRQPLDYATSCEQTLAEWPEDEEERQSIRAECEQLEQGDCCNRRETCRAIDPWRVDHQRMCLELLSGQARCTSRFRICDPTPALAVSPEGEAFVFGNDCVLESWDITGSADGPNSHVFSWPTCAAR